MNPSVLIVYVQLGDNPSPTLQHYPKLNSRLIPDAKNVLITDNPKEHIDFPGDVVCYPGESTFPGFNEYAGHNRAYSSIAGGYWRFTMERLFALNVLEEHYLEDCPVLHIESDVMLLLDRATLETMTQKFSVTSVPRYSSSDGIASILFSTSVSQLSEDLLKLDALLADNLNVSSDMALLGLALDYGVFDELPSHPDNALIVNGSEDQSIAHIVFDGAAYGQYLFGRDPIHTSNRVVSGYLNPCFQLNLSKVSWSTKPTKDVSRPSFFWDDHMCEVVNVHMHSKLLVDPSSSHMWNKILDEANGLRARFVGPIVDDLIHTIPGSYIDRIRLMKRRGLKQSVFNRVARLISKINPR